MVEVNTLPESGRMLAERVSSLTSYQQQLIYQRTDRLFAGLMLFQWLAGIAAALWISPQTWAGAESRVHLHVWAALYLGGAITALPVFLALTQPGSALTRHAIAIGQMLTSALLIDLTGGRIETHFHVFGSLAFLAFYRDWRVLISATAVVAIDHFARGVYWPQSVYGVLTASPWRWLEHTGWVLFEDVFLIAFCRQGVRDLEQMAERQVRLEMMNETIAATVTDLKVSEARKTSILESALDAIITMDHEGKVLEFNPAAEKTFGYSRAEVMGRDMAELVMPPTIRAQYHVDLAHHLATGNGLVLGKRLEMPAIRADGSEFPIELSINQIPMDGPPLFTGYLRDITERQRLERELEARIVELAKADQAKDHFLAVLAHELRNPLGAISNALQLLKRRGTDDPWLVGPHEIIERQIQHQSHMLDDLLNVSRIARGKITLYPVRLDLVQLVRDVVEDHRHELEAARLTLVVRLPEMPVWVQGDPTRLAQVFSNVLANATKFTDPGGAVTVELEAEGNRAVASVQDTGIGIEPDLLPRVFESFSQAERSLHRSRGGLGLGLALVRGLMELHGGSVAVESEGLGKGTLICLLLPLAADTAAPVAQHSVLPALTGSLRILVVEDNEDAAATLGELLELSGCRVAMAHDGIAAVELAEEFQPEVVLCDLGLPGMDGYQVARELRRRPATARARLIAVSGYGMEEDRRRAGEAGFDLHITKPMNFDELGRLLEEGVENRLV
jgi:two-component system, sensor histidine kinase and response regulator